VFPLQLELDSPLQVARWRPLVHWLLVIPHFVVVYAIGAVQSIVWFIGWFAILFTGKMPEGFTGVLVMTLRYQWRVTSFMLFMRESYPPFEFPTVAADPGNDPARLSVQPAPTLSRGLIFIKWWLLAIPHYFALLFLGLGAYFAILIGFFAVLFTGAWPEGLRTYIIGVMRWSNRVNAYVLNLTDEYPPFSLS